jgi:hypothetical protein
MKQLAKYSSLFFPLLIILLTGVLAWKNFVPGTFLSGWDTLHPEFNLALYLKRAFWGVWQEHQGVGAVASQAHAAELPRLLIVGLLNLILPINLVRYCFFFLTLGIGSLGAYFLSKYLLSIHSERFSREASFLAGAFYVLNLATLQEFYVPLEMFAVHFAVLPWLFFLAIAYLREGKRKLLLGFSLATVFGASMAHTPTLFYSYLGAFGLFLLSAFAFVRRANLLKRGVILLIMTIVLNLYWLAPNLYFLANHAQDVTNSKIHRVFSDEAFLQSQAYGDFENLGKLKNFLFNWREYSFSQARFVDLMDEWNGFGYSLTLIVIFGIGIAFLRKSRYALALLPLLAACVFFLINSNPPFTGAFDLLRERFSLFREGLRFPFTKFSILLVAAVSVYLAFALQLVMQLLGRVKLGFVFMALGFSFLVYSMLPGFKGNLISPSMKVSIPQEYFDTFAWFDAQPKDGRVAKLPLNTFWGWNYYTWGYQGAGFSWFGIPQPTLDREFDRWSPYNESFYNEASSALYAQDLEELEKTLEKYGVQYLLLDESIVNAGGDSRVLYIPETKEMLTMSKHISKTEQFGALTIYKTDFEAGKDFILAPKTYKKEAKELMPSDTVDILRPFLKAPDIVEDLSKDRGFSEAVNCDLLKIGTVGKKHLEEGIEYTAGGGGVSCDFLEYPDLKYNESIVIRVSGENTKGRSLKIYLYNVSSGRMDLEELQPKGKFDEYYFVPAKKIEGTGYILNLETRSYGRIASENILRGVEIYKIPENLSSNISTDTDGISYQNNLTVLEVKRVTPVFYKVKTQGNGVLELSQGFEKGWLAFRVGRRLEKLNHIRVNGWANGWELSGDSKIIILFWPQILEFLGIGVTVFALTSLLRKT